VIGIGDIIHPGNFTSRIRHKNRPQLQSDLLKVTGGFYCMLSGAFRTERKRRDFGAENTERSRHFSTESDTRRKRIHVSTVITVNDLMKTLKGGLALPASSFLVRAHSRCFSHRSPVPFAGIANVHIVIEVKYPALRAFLLRWGPTVLRRHPKFRPKISDLAHNLALIQNSLKVPGRSRMRSAVCQLLR
jgi:hypothetical protein